ncbi:MAG: Holliday junction resolvase RuvX [Thermodesulfobacteriota bacterium]
MRILALDLGTKTIGVAVSDELEIAAHGVTTIKRKDFKRDLEALGKIIDEYMPAQIVVGVPYKSDGTVGRRGSDIFKFAEDLKKTFSLPVEFWDESFSTVNAEKILLEADLSRGKRKKIIDKMAAVFILEEYLESKRQISQPRIDQLKKE